MIDSPILQGLNEAQRDAVSAPVGPVLVLAGAGSGKTRVLTHRIAWVIQNEGASPYSILAVTFTNKAAAEMRHRIEKLLGVPGGAMWVGTFHGIAHRLLRLHWREANLPQSFQILDGEDQLRLVKKILKAMELDDTRWVPREVQWFINHNKDEGHRPGTLKDAGDPTRATLIRVYKEYEAQCQRTGVVDFAELLLRAYELCRDNAALHLPLPPPLQARAHRRVPGHQRHPVRLGAVDRGARWRAVHRRRRRPVHLPLARREGREPHALHARLPGGQDVSAWSRTTAPRATSSRPPTR